MAAEFITKKQAVRAALKKLSLFGNKELQANLDMVIGGSCSRCTEARSLAEAYRIGVEEAQREIARRLDAMKGKVPS